MAFTYNPNTDYVARVMPNGSKINLHSGPFGAYITPKGELLDTYRLRYLMMPYEHVYSHRGIFDDYITERHDLKNVYTLKESCQEILEKLKREKEYLKSKKEKYAMKRPKDKILTQMTQVEIDFCDLFIKCFSSSKIESRPGYINGRKNDIFDLTKVLGVPISFDVKYVSYSNDAYYRNLSNELLLKEIMVRHLGYHSVETIRDKTITSALWNITDPFYDYSLADYDIQQISGFNWNEEEETYIERPLYEEHFYKEENNEGEIITKSIFINKKEFLISDSELRTKEELALTKKLVPLEERPKYFRNQQN